MSNFIVSARKYRPVRFEEVVGQEHVGQTLKNAFKNEQLAHAFLFCGPRGVGKTTCARILAKVLNCQNVTADYEPCNECGSCKSFNQNASFNITELDAASNNSVEHIRALIEQVRFQPQQGKYKVFIIDEVHMLSQQAFNAFLKTLEEPPPYAIFILATTEKHKIIPTILSRCQIFDFKRIQIPAMVKHLQSICESENIQADKDALHIIAQKADGALRDALSIFDRIVAFSGKNISYEDVISNLNVLDYDYYFRFVDALLSEDVSNVMLIFDDVLRKGFDGDLFINGLAEHIRNLLVCKDKATLDLLEVSEGLKDRYQTQAALSPTALLLSALNIANDCDINYKMARNKRLHVEIALIKMTYILRSTKVSPLSIANDTEKKTPDLSNLSNASVDGQEKTVKKTEKVISPSSSPEEKQIAESEQAVEAKPEDSAPVKKMVKKATPNLKGGLDAMLEEVKKDDDANLKLERPIELTPEKIQKVWVEFLKLSEQDSVKALLKSVEIKVEEENITAVVGSKLVENTMRQETGLMDFIREKLNAPNLTLTIKIDKSKAPEPPKKKKILTPKDKYRKMLETNPNLKELQSRFQLRPDE